MQGLTRPSVDDLPTPGEAAATYTTRRATDHKFFLVTAVLLLTLVLGACGDGPPLDQQCVDIPEPMLENPDGQTTTPASPPFEEIIYRWLCVEGFFVEERWTVNENGCWILSDTFRRPNPGCDETAELKPGNE